MRQDYFECLPQFKLLIAGNHKPSLRSVDEAIRRRFNLIPFSVTIAKETDLDDKLKAERPGILQWMLDGCMAWREQGLAPPEAVTNATAAYLEAEDSISSWIAERCERASEDSLANLYASWKQWVVANGVAPLTNKWLSQALDVRGFEPRKRTRGKQLMRFTREPTRRTARVFRARTNDANGGALDYRRHERVRDTCEPDTPPFPSPNAIEGRIR
jgi:putative DNA primase/helicase